MSDLLIQHAVLVAVIAIMLAVIVWRVEKLAKLLDRLIVLLEHVVGRSQTDKKEK